MASESGEQASSSGSQEQASSSGSQTIRSCRGCLFYSSAMREQRRNPVCLGLARSHEHEVFTVHNDLDKELANEVRDFKYACIGYSVLKEARSDQSTADGPRELPYCVGLEFLANQAPAPSPSAANSKPLEQGPGEDVVPRPPPSSRGGGRGGLISDEFATRFFRTSRLVANAVYDNVGKVAHNVRSTIERILTSDQGRPKT